MPQGFRGLAQDYLVSQTVGYPLRKVPCFLEGATRVTGDTEKKRLFEKKKSEVIRISGVMYYVSVG
jgi:hypothetical protein